MEQPDKSLVLKKTVYSMEQKFNSAVDHTSSVKFQKEAGFALQAVGNNSYMFDNIIKSEDTKKSFLEAIYNVALTDISLNPILKMAYLIPRKARSGKHVHIYLEPSYQGLINAMVTSGNAKDVYASVVYDTCDFDMDMGTEKHIKHKPYYLVGADKGEEIGVYAVAVLPDGTKKFEFLPIARVNNIMKRSEAYKANKERNIWVGDDREEMVKKTAVKALWKYMPKIGRMEHIAQAIEVDNNVNGINFEAETAVKPADAGASAVQNTEEQITEDAPHEEVKNESTGA